MLSLTRRRRRTTDEVGGRSVGSAHNFTCASTHVSSVCASVWYDQKNNILGARRGEARRVDCGQRRRRPLLPRLAHESTGRPYRTSAEERQRRDGARAADFSARSPGWLDLCNTRPRSVGRRLAIATGRKTKAGDRSCIPKLMMGAGARVRLLPLLLLLLGLGCSNGGGRRCSCRAQTLRLPHQEGT